MGDNSFAPYSSPTISFVVKNVSVQKKMIKIFNYPILYNTTRDLMKIPGISESEIRASLLKGELNHKILANDIEIMTSDINLLQFNQDNLSFLINHGIKQGIMVGYKNSDVIHYEDQRLVGNINSFNTTFKVANPPFIQDDVYKIIIFWNGIKQSLSNDYIIAESKGPGTGYNTVILLVAPDSGDIISANYYTYQ